MFLSGAAVVAAFDWPWKAKLFPLVIGIPVFGLATAEVLWSLFGTTSRDRAMDFQLSGHLPARVMLARTLRAAGWMVGFFGAIVLLGFPIAVPLFVLLYLRLQGHESWGLSVAITVAVWGFFYGLFDRLLHLPFPAGLIQGWMGLA
jgi:hypothetical protein